MVNINLKIAFLSIEHCMCHPSSSCVEITVKHNCLLISEYEMLHPWDTKIQIWMLTVWPSHAWILFWMFSTVVRTNCSWLLISAYSLIQLHFLGFQLSFVMLNSFNIIVEQVVCIQMELLLFLSNFVWILLALLLSNYMCFDFKFFYMST